MVHIEFVCLLRGCSPSLPLSGFMLLLQIVLCPFSAEMHKLQYLN